MHVGNFGKARKYTKPVVIITGFNELAVCSYFTCLLLLLSFPLYLLHPDVSRGFIYSLWLQTIMSDFCTKWSFVQTGSLANLGHWPTGPLANTGILPYQELWMIWGFCPTRALSKQGLWLPQGFCPTRSFRSYGDSAQPGTLADMRVLPNMGLWLTWVLCPPRRFCPRSAFVNLLFYTDSNQQIVSCTSTKPIDLRRRSWLDSYI